MGIFNEISFWNFNGKKDWNIKFINDKIKFRKLYILINLEGK